MKKNILVVLILVVYTCVDAQRTVEFDSITYEDDGFVTAKAEMLNSDFNCRLLPFLLDNDSMYRLIELKCPSLPIVNFNTHLLLYYRIYRDINTTLLHRLYLDTNKKEMVWRIYHIYDVYKISSYSGHLMLVEKPPVGYAIKLSEVYQNKHDSTSQFYWHKRQW